MTDVTNICDRHRGRSPCEYPAFLLSCLSTVLCVRASGLGSLAIAAATACEPFDREGPPQVYNRPCRLRPSAAAPEIRRGCIYHHLNSLPRDKWFRSGSCRSNWRNATTGESGPTDFGETRQHVWIVLCDCVVNRPVPSWIWGIFTSQLTIVGISC